MTITLNNLTLYEAQIISDAILDKHHELKKIKLGETHTPQRETNIEFTREIAVRIGNQIRQGKRNICVRKA